MSQRSSYGLLVSVILLGCALPSPTLTAADPPCSFGKADVEWLEAILDGWARATRDFLDIDGQPLPRIVLLGSACVWHLPAEIGEPAGPSGVHVAVRFEGQNVLVEGVPHEGTVTLPNGARIPAEIVAAAMPGHDGGTPFFVLALPELWEQHPQASRDPHLSVRISSVALHEMIHTRQLPWLQRIFDELGETYDLPDRFDDDVIEKHFADSVEFTKMFDAERTLMYGAVAERDPARKRALLRQALSTVKARQSRFFVGENEVYGELEGLFLNMEGVAEWVRFKHHQADPEWPSADAEIVGFLRGQDNNWSQDEGLALILLLDDLVPGWQRRILDPEMPSPIDILADAIGASE